MYLHILDFKKRCISGCCAARDVYGIKASDEELVSCVGMTVPEEGGEKLYGGIKSVPRKDFKGVVERDGSAQRAGRAPASKREILSIRNRRSAAKKANQNVSQVQKKNSLDKVDHSTTY